MDFTVTNNLDFGDLGGGEIDPITRARLQSSALRSGTRQPQRAPARSTSLTSSPVVPPPDSAAADAARTAGRPSAASYAEQAEREMDSVPDYSAQQAEQRGRQGIAHSALVMALAAQNAGKGFEPLQQSYLQRSVVQPIKVEGGYIDEQGNVVTDPGYKKLQKTEMLFKRGEFAAREADREAQRQQSERQFREKLVDAQAARDQNEALRRSLAGVNQQQQPPVQVVGPDGQPVFVTREQAIGKTPYIQKTAAPLPESATNNLNKSYETAREAGALSSTFKDDYGGGPVAATKASLGSYMPGGSDTADWWKRYQAQRNLVRHGLFGGALTPTETAEWEKADIAPGMSTTQIRTNLDRQATILANSHERLRAGTFAQSRGEQADLFKLPSPSAAAPSAAPPSVAGRAAVKVGSKAEYDALPAGRSYIGANGQIAIKGQ